MIAICANCRHFVQHRGGGIGTCAMGGPKPEEGCSDVGDSETCEKHEEVKK